MQVFRAQQVFRGLARFSTKVSKAKKIYAKGETDEFFVFPANVEGDDPMVNWNLAEDGVTNAGLAFRNTPIEKLLKRAGIKDTKNPIEIASLKVKTGSKLFESGDNLDHDEFGENLKQVQNYLSEGVDMFVEDLAVGSHPDFRLGVRVVTRQPEIALAARSVLFKVPPRPIKRNAGRKGWNFDGRYRPSVDENAFWDGKQYVDIPETEAKQGVRPIVVLIGQTGSTLANEHIATQFVEFKSEIVGATIVAGENASVSSLLQAIGNAGSVILNNDPANGVVALPSATFVKNGKSFVVVNATEEVISAGVASGATLYSAHYTALSNRGVASVLAGGITQKAALAPAPEAVVSVAAGGKAAFFTGLAPDNLTFPASKVIVFDENGAAKTTAETAKDLLVELSDVKKEVALGALLQQSGVVVATKAAQVPALFV